MFYAGFIAATLQEVRNVVPVSSYDSNEAESVALAMAALWILQSPIIHVQQHKVNVHVYDDSMSAVHVGRSVWSSKCNSVGSLPHVVQCTRVLPHFGYVQQRLRASCKTHRGQVLNEAVASICTLVSIAAISSSQFEKKHCLYVAKDHILLNFLPQEHVVQYHPTFFQQPIFFAS